MVEFFWARNTFVQIPAFPAEISAADGKTLLDLQHMIDRYRVIKSAMGIVGAAEDILALVLIDQFRVCWKMIFNQAEKTAFHADPLR